MNSPQDRYVRTWVARNPNTAPEILAQLSQDKDISVRRYVLNIISETMET